VKHDPDKVGRLLQSLARNVATEVNISTLATDAAGSDRILSRNTVASYLDTLERLMVVEPQPAWAPHLRSKAILRNSAKLHFVDPSLAVAALNANPSRLLADLNLLGLLFESLVVRDLRIYAQGLDGQVRHYRDSNGLEVDAIVETDAGQWAAFEVKLSPASVEAGAASLLKFAAGIDTVKCGPPAALTVITGTGYGYVRPDGIAVIPIGALGP
jgi:predicted AAA+ superfamily ATPase